MRRCLGFILVGVFLEFDSRYRMLSSCTEAACCRARSDSSRFFCIKDADLTGGERESLEPLKIQDVKV